MTDSTATPTYTGSVVWFSASKGFGFIACPTLDRDVFVHYSAIQKDGFKKLSENDKVEFELGSNEKGQIAVNVQVL